MQNEFVTDDEMTGFVKGLFKEKVVVNPEWELSMPVVNKKDIEGTTLATSTEVKNFINNLFEK